MPELLIAYDPSKPVGQRLAPEVRAEMALLASGTVPPSRSVGDDQLDDRSVTDRTIDDDAVDTRSIRDGAVTTDTIAPRSVTGAEVATQSLRGEHIAQGIPTSHDSNANEINLDFMPITSADYAALEAAGTVDPNTAYLIREL